MRQNPLLGFAYGAMARRSQSALLPQLQQPIATEKKAAPRKQTGVVLKRRAYAIAQQLANVEACRHRPALAECLHDGKRNDDGPRPGGHLINEIAGEDHFGRNGRRVLPRIKAEEAEIDFDVAVGRLQAAMAQDAL